MEAVNRRVLAMADRVADFTTAHPSTDGGFVAVLAQFQASVTRGQALAQQERDGRIAEQVAVASRRALRFNTIVPLLRRLSRVGGTLNSGAEQFPLPRPGAPNAVLITAAKSVLAAATAQKDALQKAGLGDTLLDELTQGISQFAAATDAAISARRQHIGAHADIRAVADQLLQDVHLLDPLIRSEYRNDPELLAAWTSARSVMRPVRVGRRGTPPPVPAPAPLRTPAPDPAPAVAPEVTPVVAASPGVTPAAPEAPAAVPAVGEQPEPEQKEAAA